MRNRMYGGVRGRKTKSRRKTTSFSSYSIFMMAMKKNIAIIAVLVISFVTSYILCGTEQNDAGIDSIKIEEYKAVLENRVSLDSVAGTYCGVLPPDVETTLTLNADGTYLLIQAYNGK